MIFFSADHHFGDTRFSILHRPFSSSKEYIKKCVSEWNKKITNNDTVYYLGDFAYGEDKSSFLSIAEQLNGNKNLILGNHDTLPKEEYLKYFNKVYSNGCLIKTKEMSFYTNHYPTNGKEQYFNLCGHIHSAFKVQKNMINVGVDVWHFAPVSLLEIKNTVNAINNFYDEDVWVAYYKCNTKHMSRGKEGSYKDN